MPGPLGHDDAAIGEPEYPLSRHRKFQKGRLMLKNLLTVFLATAIVLGILNTAQARQWRCNRRIQHCSESVACTYRECTHIYTDLNKHTTYLSNVCGLCMRIYLFTGGVNTYCDLPPYTREKAIPYDPCPMKQYETPCPP